MNCKEGARLSDMQWRARQCELWEGARLFEVQ